MEANDGGIFKRLDAREVHSAQRLFGGLLGAMTLGEEQVEGIEHVGAKCAVVGSTCAAALDFDFAQSTVRSSRARCSGSSVCTTLPMSLLAVSSRRLRRSQPKTLIGKAACVATLLTLTDHFLISYTPTPIQTASFDSG